MSCTELELDIRRVVEKYQWVPLEVEGNYWGIRGDLR